MIYETNEQLLPLIILGSIGGTILFCAICGYIAHILGENRGFTRTQFWWGFFLNIIGIMWVAIMPTYRIYDEDEEMFDSRTSKRRELDHYAPALKPKYPMENAKPKNDKKEEYWGNDISSLSEGKEEIKK